MDIIKLGTLGPFVLCQDCLAVADYTDARHLNEEKCACGGDFCGCNTCNDDAERLQCGEITKQELIAELEGLKQAYEGDEAMIPPYAVVPPVCIDGEDDELPF